MKSLNFSLALCFAFGLSSCGGGGSDSSSETNTADPVISAVVMSRDDVQPLLEIGTPPDQQARDINGDVSIGYTVTDVDDQSFGRAPTSSCKYRFGSSGSYISGCAGIDLTTQGGKILEYEITATDSYGDTLRTVTKKDSFDIHKNTAPSYTSGLSNTGCDQGGGTLALPSATFGADPENDTVSVSYSVGNPYDCASGGTFIYFATATDEFGLSSDSPNFSITVCPPGLPWNGASCL